MTTKVLPRPGKRHYHLISAEITYDETAEGPRSIKKLNGILVTDGQHITSADIGRSQQIIAMRFMNEVPDASNAIVVDIFTHGFSYLGLQSERTFVGPTPEPAPETPAVN